MAPPPPTAARVPHTVKPPPPKNRKNHTLGLTRRLPIKNGSSCVLSSIVAGSLMKVTPTFNVRALTRLPISTTQSRVEVSITDNTDVQNSDESIAFSVLIQHKANPSLQNLQYAALKRAQDILASQHRTISGIGAKTIGS